MSEVQAVEYDASAAARDAARYRRLRTEGVIPNFHHLNGDSEPLHGDALDVYVDHQLRTDP